MTTRHILAAALTCWLATPALAQNATGTGTGIGVSGSNSQSGAAANNAGIGNSTAVGTGVSRADSLSASGAAATGNQVNISSPANTNSNVNSTVSGTTTSNVNQTVSGSTTSNVNTRVSGTSTVKTNPSLAIGLAAAGLETCLGSASAGLSLAGFGLTGGSTYTDEGCQARLDSRTLWSYGLKQAAVWRMCLRPHVYESMPDICEMNRPGAMRAGLPVRALMSAEGSAGAMRVIDGRDGVEKDCLNYNSAKQKCYHWAGERSTARRVAAITPSKTLPKPKPVAPKSPPTEPAAAPKT
jgi:hypothetical protein